MRAAQDRLGLDRTAWLLALAAALVYLPGLWWGLPHATGPVTIRGWDVDAVTGVSTLAEFSNLLASRQPDWYVAYPMLHYLILGVAYAPYLAFLKLSGGLGAPAGQYPFGLADPITAIATLSLLGRVVTLAMACGTVVAAYLAARTLWDRRTGVAAAVIVMLAAPMVYYARTGNLDVPVLFWTAAGFVVVAAIVADGYSVRRGAWLGVFAALAVGTKDQAYGVWVPVIAVLAVSDVITPRRPDAAGRRGAGVLATVVAGAVTYAVASGLVLSPQRFVAHVRFVTGFQESFYNVLNMPGLLRPATPAGWARLSLDVLVGMVAALGPLVVAAAAAGALVTWRERRLAAVALAAGALGFVALVIFPVRHMQYRYVLVPGFIAALFAARAWSAALARGGWWRGGARVVGAIALVWLGARAADLTWQMVRDARGEAGAWLAARARPGDRVGFFGAAHQLPSLPAGVEPVRLPGGDSAASALATPAVTYVLVIPDYFSDEKRERSTFLPADAWRRLQDGSLGWVLVARFTTAPLIGPVAFLPYVNPQVQIFQRSGTPLAR